MPPAGRQEPDDLFTRVWQNADRSRRNDQKFREFWQKPGLEVKDILGHRLWFAWVKRAIADQWEAFYGKVPRIITWDQTYFLRLAAMRHERNRTFLPFAQDKMQKGETGLLDTLRKNGKLAEVPSNSDVGIFRVDAKLGPLTLRVTDKDRGGGVKVLKGLVDLGFLREVPAENIESTCYFDESGGRLTLELTGGGHTYIKEFQRGGFSQSIEQEDGIREKIPGSMPLFVDGDKVEKYIEKSKEKSFDDPAFLRYCDKKGSFIEKDEKGSFIEKYAEAYKLLVLGGMKQVEVCAKLDINDTTLSRWKKKYDKLGKREELRVLYAHWIMRSRD